MHGVAAQDEGGHQHELAKRRQPQQLAHPAGRRTHGRCGVRVLQFRDPACGHGGGAQEQGLQPDNHVEAPGAHRLPGQQGATNESR